MDIVSYKAFLQTIRSNDPGVRNMAVQTPRLAQRRKAQATAKKTEAPKQGVSKSSSKSVRQNAWQKLYDRVVQHPSFGMWLYEHEMTLEQFEGRRHRFAELKAIQEWNNRYWLLQKLEDLQSKGGMTDWLRTNGYSSVEIISLWSTDQLQKAWDDLHMIRRSDKNAVDRLGLAVTTNGYKGKTRSHASKRAKRPRREANAPRNGTVHLRNQGKSLVSYAEVADNLPNAQGGPVQRGQAVAHAGLTSQQMGERKKRSPTRRKRIK